MAINQATHQHATGERSERYRLLIEQSVADAGVSVFYPTCSWVR